MLKSLTLENFVLIEKAKVFFDPGINLLSGETGSGKTALIDALSLISGARADYSKIRKDCTRAFIEAIFDPPPSIFPLLEEAGIAFEPDEELSIQRELLSSGKSRGFIANQSASLLLLQKLAPHLLNIIDQQAYHILRSEEGQAIFLDLYVDAQEALNDFQKNWQKEKKLAATLYSLKDKSSEREKMAALYLAQKEELDEANLKENEDETLFSEYERLSNATSLTQASSEILQRLQEDEEALLPYLRTLYPQCLKLSTHPPLAELPELIRASQVALEEIAHSLTSFIASLEKTPSERLAFLEERLKLIEKLKKKYRTSVEGMISLSKQLDAKLAHLETLEDSLLQYEKQLKEAEKKSCQAAERLTSLRRSGAHTLGKELSEALKKLNIPDAIVSIEVIPATRHARGEDQTIFYLQANRGEHRVPVKESASGGELARLLFALTTLLSHKSTSATLIFDEIDASIGGETATMMGQSLLYMALKRQLFVITHFPQVASIRGKHFRIYKTEKEGRTVGYIEPLDPLAREKELLRMMGGHFPNLNEVTK